MQQLTAGVPPEKRVPPPLNGARPVSALLSAGAAASNGNGNGNGTGHGVAANNVVAFTPASVTTNGGPSVASEQDAGVQSLLKPLKVGCGVLRTRNGAH